ncbi:DgyrCDS5636 [Dimorphilus gyrociliatus]|uniref:DgyrCDS5636 n=1 Tax=Dimorphilus gyrociliatus TaxID=2664684 RepID=A0A7I8VL42_9ANNE|nr:DgyrCDS5636 [Dimorphilus gyrociliatus]
MNNSTLNEKDNVYQHPMPLILRAFLTSLVAVLLVVCNIFSMNVLAMTKQIPKISRMCLINLAFADCMLGLISCAPSVPSSVTGTWLFGEVFCQISGMNLCANATVSIWSVLLVSIDRYFAILHPMKYRDIITEKRLRITIGFMWLGAYGLFVLPVLLSKRFIYYIYSPKEIVCGDFWQFAWFGIMAVVSVPVLTSIGLLYCTISIVLHLRAHKNQISDGSKASDGASKRNIKAIKLLVITASAYYLAWMPYAIHLFIVLIPKDPPFVHPVLKFCLLWTGMSNSFTNVLIYLSVYAAFRHNGLILINKVTCKLCLGKIIEKSHQSTLNSTATG